MPQPKLPDVDWNDAAWAVANALEKLPTRTDRLFGPGGAKAGPLDTPIGASAGHTVALGLFGIGEAKAGPLDSPLRAAAERTLRRVTAHVERHISYRMDVSVKQQPPRAKNRHLRLAHALETYRGRRQIDFYEWLAKSRVPLSRNEIVALLALLKLRQVVSEGCVSSADRRFLPLLIAAIQGESASKSASKSAAHGRNVDKRSPLTKLIATEREKDDFVTCEQVRDRLLDGDAAVRDVVIEYRDERLYYRNERDEITSVSIEQFHKLFAQSKPGS